MTLDEAIEHAKEVARTCDDSQCAADHLQLAEWLRKARGTEKAARWYTARIRELEEENIRLHVFSKSAWQVMTRNEPLWVWKDMEADARELGIEENE